MKKWETLYEEERKEDISRNRKHRIKGTNIESDQIELERKHLLLDKGKIEIFRMDCALKDR